MSSQNSQKAVIAANTQRAATECNACEADLQFVREWLLAISEFPYTGYNAERQMRLIARQILHRISPNRSPEDLA